MCSGVLDQKAIDMIAVGSNSEDTIRHALESSPFGVGMFLDPTGSPLRSFTVDDSETGAQRPVEFLQNEEGVLYAGLELERCVEGKQYHDVVGGYQRLDVFHLQVNRERQDPVIFK
jgi:hypothetical protein